MCNMLQRRPNVLSTLKRPLTLLAPAVPNCCCPKGSAPYWSNPSFLFFDIWALWRSGLSARAPECQKLKMVGSTSMAIKCKALTRSAMKGLSQSASDQWTYCSFTIVYRNSINARINSPVVVRYEHTTQWCTMHSAVNFDAFQRCFRPHYNERSQHYFRMA